jgi:hypothetical protein
MAKASARVSILSLLSLMASSFSTAFVAGSDSLVTE